MLATAELALHLDVALGAPLLRVERLAHDAAGTAVEFARDVFRCDRVEFLVRRTPDAPVTLRALSDPA
jgi:GntR family transcriptional regulator